MALFTSGSAPRTTRASATQIVSKSGYKVCCRAVGSIIVLLFYRRVFWAVCRTVRNGCLRMTSIVAGRIVTAFSQSTSCRCIFWADSATVRDDCFRMTRNVANRIVVVFSQSIACRLAHEKDTRTAFWSVPNMSGRAVAGNNFPANLTKYAGYYLTYCPKLFSIAVQPQDSQTVPQ